MRKLREWIMPLAWFALTVWILCQIDFGKDSTDPPSGRSGMALRIDHATGCHYLAGLFSAPQPRLDASGAHICTGEAGEAILREAP